MSSPHAPGGPAPDVLDDTDGPAEGDRQSPERSGRTR